MCMKSRCNDHIKHHTSIFMRSKHIWEFHKSFAKLWDVVEAAVLVPYMIIRAPAKVLSDQGFNFESNIIKGLCELMGI